MNIVPVKNGINFRDLGGIPAAKGKTVKSGLLFRSGAFYQLTPNDCHFLTDELKLKSILDYRDQSEIDERPNILWQGAEYYNIPANPLSNDVNADIARELKKQAEGEVSRSASDYMIELYRLLPFRNPAYEKLTALLCESDVKPMVQHCAIGKDRTGVGVAMTLFALGAPEEVVLDDYLLTEKTLASFRNKVLDEMAPTMSEAELANFQGLFAAKEEYLTSALTEIKSKYHTVDAWLEHEYGLSAAKREFLQRKYLV